MVDRLACKSSWVLLLGINQKGQVLPSQAREKATYVGEHHGFWLNGEPLNTHDDSQIIVVYERENIHEDSGWESE